ncbi:tripartite tricarboxylate transporter substrate binding protein [Cupriavidus necator]|uniref:Tripartite tricarboxylate transporter substrate binding protein n=2 Tax=Cupriavidus necator TaxID=106590 RepID=A0A367P977_CUPNE|nr:tripartite tricarboxylate transporter substrate binding protein [Cupriavidus necator]
MTWISFPRRRALMAMLVLLCGPVSAQSYPDKPVRVVVPFPAGGGTDVVARIAGSALQVNMKQAIVVDNRPGASGVIGSDYVAKAQPDGYTLLFTIPILLQTASAMPKIPYDPLRDFVPVTTLVSAPLWLAVSTSRVKATDFAAFTSEAKATTKKWEYSSFGNASSSHLYGHALNQALSAGMLHVPYKGGSAAVQALANGEVAAMWTDYPSVRPYVASGKVRIIASSGAKRSRLTPDVPTLSELGLPGFEALGWGAFFAPVGTPPEVVKRLQTEISAVTRNPEVVKKFADLGYEPGGKPQPEFAADVRADQARWSALIKAADIRLD